MRAFAKALDRLLRVERRAGVAGLVATLEGIPAARREDARRVCAAYLSAMASTAMDRPQRDWTRAGPGARRRWVDHPSRYRWRGGTVYLAEPYDLGVDDLRDLIRLADDGWKVSVSGWSAHFPGWTCAVRLWTHRID